MISSLHLQLDDGTLICVPSHEACFYIEKFAADGCALESARECPGCPMSAGINLATELGVLNFDASCDSSSAHR